MTPTTTILFIAALIAGIILPEKMDIRVRLVSALVFSSIFAFVFFPLVLSLIEQPEGIEGQEFIIGKIKDFDYQAGTSGFLFYAPSSCTIEFYDNKKITANGSICDSLERGKMLYEKNVRNSLIPELLMRKMNLKEVEK